MKIIIYCNLLILQFCNYTYAYQKCEVLFSVKKSIISNQQSSPNMTNHLRTYLRQVQVIVERLTKGKTKEQIKKEVHNKFIEYTSIKLQLEEYNKSKEPLAQKVMQQKTLLYQNKIKLELELVSYNLYTVSWFIRAHIPNFTDHGTVDKLDLIQQGNLGLIAAVKTYDPNKAAFLSYAEYYFMQYIYNYLTNNQSIVTKMPKSTEHTLLFKILKIKKILIANGYDENHLQYVQKIAYYANSSEHKVENILQILIKDIHIDAIESAYKKDKMLIRHMLQSRDIPDHEKSPFDLLAEKEEQMLREHVLQLRLERFMEQLKKREISYKQYFDRAIFIARTRLFFNHPDYPDYNNPPKQDEIGIMFNISRSRVQQIESHLREILDKVDGKLEEEFGGNAMP